MTYQICPICDQKLTRKNYCSHCRQRIRKPLTIDVDYYLNERHPETEHECTYHDYTSWSQEDAGADSRTAVPNQPRKSVVPNQPRKPAASVNRPAGTFSQPGKAASANRPAKTAAYPDRRPSTAGQSRTTAVLVIVVAAVLIFVSAVIFLLNAFERQIRNCGSSGIGVPESIQEADWDDLFPAGALSDDEYTERELTAEEVIAAGQTCNSMGHFRLTADELSGELIPYVNSLSGEAPREETASSNTEDSYGYSYYSTYYDYYYGEPGYFTLSADTATSQLHSITFSWNDASEAMDILEKTVGVLRGSGDWSLSEEETAGWLTDLKNRLDSIDFDTVSPEAIADSIDIFLSCEDDEYYFSIYKERE